MEKQGNKIEFNKFEKINIYLTGYGPFQEIKENPAEKVSTFLFENKDQLKTKYTSILYNQIFEVKTKYVDNNICKIFNFIEKNNIGKKTLHILVSFGVAENRLINTIETLGQNYIYDLIVDKKIDEGKPEKYFSKTPVKNIIKGIQNCNNIKCKYSNNAGTYLCNYMYYTTLTKCLNSDNVCSFFIHIPKLENYDLNKHEKFFRNFISVLEDLYIIGNDEKRNKILNYEINEEEDEHIDEWNKKKAKKEEKEKGKDKEDKEKEKEENEQKEENEKKEEKEELENKGKEIEIKEESENKPKEFEKNEKK